MQLYKQFLGLLESAVPISTYHLCVTLLNFQLLVDWTRGKNLIISSAAPTVYELRGPYDVANLSFLLGLSLERAKAAVSKNCRYDDLQSPHSYVDIVFNDLETLYSNVLQDSYNQSFEEKTISQRSHQG